MSEDVRTRLEAYYVQLDSDVRITELAAIGDGWETEVYSFTRTQGEHSEALILRMYPGSDAFEKSTHEFGSMYQLRHAANYPVPRVYSLENTPGWLGKPFIIMQKIDGQPLGEVMRKDTAGPSA